MGDDKGWVSRELQLISHGITRYEKTSIWVVRVVGDIGPTLSIYTQGADEMEVTPFLR